MEQQVQVMRLLLREEEEEKVESLTTIASREAQRARIDHLLQEKLRQIEELNPEK